jgi:tellurite resistance protein TehA-like permease
MTARWLLPVMTLMVASTSGGIVGRALEVYSQLHSLQTLLVSVFMVTVGFTLTLMILTIYLMRLFLHGLPPDAMVLSAFLPIGPTSQTGYSILLMGQNFRKLLPFLSRSSGFFNNASMGIVVEVVCTFGSFILWSLATMWTLYALLAVYSGVRQSRIAFKVSFWGLVFPNVISLSLFVYYTSTKCTSFRLSTHTIQSN